MAYKITDSGVEISRGRGAAKVSLTVDFSSLDRWARRMRLDTKKLWYNSFGRACKGLRNKLAQVMANAGGVNGVPKFKDFEEFTKLLRARAGISSRPMGALLADKSFIVAYKHGNTQIIGWPDYLSKTAVNFQDGAGGAYPESFFTDPQKRAYMHRRAASNFVPPAYVHNPRRVLPEPFGAYIRQNLDSWARGAFYKQLAQLMVSNSKGARS